MSCLHYYSENSTIVPANPSPRLSTVILYQIILGVFIGVAVGISARKVLKFSKRRSFIDRESMVAMYVSLAIFTTAATTLAGSDDLLAAFACGAAFAWDDWFSESIGEPA